MQKVLKSEIVSLDIWVSWIVTSYHVLAEYYDIDQIKESRININKLSVMS